MKVLIIEDDPITVEVVSLVLETDGLLGTKLISASSGVEGIKVVQRESPDLVIIDLGLPDGDGMLVLERLREFSDVPVIILTARNERSAMVKGLDLGADDYVVKPFAPLVLRARIKSVMRRSCLERPPHGEEPVQMGDLVVNLASREIVRRGDPVKLSATEWNLLDCLMKNSGVVVPYRTIWEKVWGTDYIGDVAALKTCIWRLRGKLGDNARSPHVIKGERGYGYRFLMPQ